MVLALIFLTVAVGAVLQRVAGMGLALVAAPILSLLLGPSEGILVVNALAFVNALIMTVVVRRWVDWRTFAPIGAVLIVGAIPGALLIREVSTAWLNIIIGSVLLVALAVVTFGLKKFPVIKGTVPAALTGIAGGFMNTVAGVAGPAMTVYAQLSRWEQRSFSATLQPIFLVAGAISVAVKVGFGAGSVTDTDWLTWPVGIAAMGIGIVVGSRLSEKVSRVLARRLALSVAAAGAVSALVRGILG